MDRLSYRTMALYYIRPKHMAMPHDDYATTRKELT